MGRPGARTGPLRHSLGFAVSVCMMLTIAPALLEEDTVNGSTCGGDVAGMEDGAFIDRVNMSEMQFGDSPPAIGKGLFGCCASKGVRNVRVTGTGTAA